MECQSKVPSSFYDLLVMLHSPCCIFPPMIICHNEVCWAYICRSCRLGNATYAVLQAEAALQQGKTLILFNPLLRDVASPDGIMSVR